MNNLNYLRSVFWTVFAALLTTQAALASTLAKIAGPDGLDLHWDIMALSFVICTVSGVAALLNRVNSELKANPDHRLPNPLLFCSSHMAGSWAAGLLAFIVGQQLHWDIWACLATMMAASFQGARWLEAYAESKIPKPPPAQEPA